MRVGVSTKIYHSLLVIIGILSLSGTKTYAAERRPNIIMIFIDDQIDLKKLCRIKKKNKSKASLELILWAILFFLMTSSRSRTTDRKLSFHGKKVIGPTFILFSFPNG